MSAIAHTQARRREPCAERFAGQLLAGIDIKTSLRACARGREELWVRNERFGGSASATDSPDGFPVIWILREGSDSASAWHLLFEPLDWLAHYARDRVESQRRFTSRNGALVPFLAHGQEPDALRQRAIGRFQCAGLILFGPVFAAWRQSCRWLEETAGKHNPIIPRGTAAASVVFDLDRQLGFEPEAMRWQDLPVATALPYSTGRVMLVAPPGLEPAEQVQAEAARRGKAIRQLPLSIFEPARVQRIGHIDLMPGWVDQRDGDAVYSPEAERLAGEQSGHYLNLVPPFWRRYRMEKCGRCRHHSITPPCHSIP